MMTNTEVHINNLFAFESASRAECRFDELKMTIKL